MAGGSGLGGGFLAYLYPGEPLVSMAHLIAFAIVMRLYPGRDLGVVVMANSTTTTYDFEPLFALLAGASWS